ncbi:hypothetical protein BGZ79_000499 [Entomortierella chlamydospora]|nr:hypothetical protein BGZ79_000499 [Entomortierella chlamydospora]
MRPRAKQSSTVGKRSRPATTPSPLYIPEILSVILSFMSQHTLIHTVRFVCKQWLAQARPWIQIHAIWKDFDNGKHNREVLYPHLHMVTDLCVKFGRGWYYDGTLTLWDELSEKIDALNATNQLYITKLAMVHVTHLIPMVYPILSKIGTLTDIHLTEVSSPEVHLGSILELCPKLRRLHIDNESCTGDHRIMDRTSPRQENTAAVASSGVETLIIRGMRIEQSIMEGILQRCSSLQRLKLDQVLDAEQHVTSFDQAKFFASVAKSCPQLKSFHFSFYNQHISSENATSLIQTFYPKNSLATPGQSNQIQPQRPRQEPFDTLSVLDRDIDRLTSHIFLAPILDPSFINVITTLEIMPSIQQSHHDCIVHALHNVLCSTPTLLHLLAPTVPYFAEYLDLSDPTDIERSYPLWNCSSGCPAAETDFTKKRIWACRGLRTLQLRFISKLKPDEANPENARKMFGYISRVCPDLRELAIYRWELNLKLEGGLCLLSRLKYLKKLTVMSWAKTKLKKKDLEWMTQYPQKKFSQRVRWRKMKKANKSKSSAMSDAKHSDTNGNIELKRDLKLEDLRDVGSIADLEACRKELWQNTSSGGCWPFLEFLGIRHSDGKHRGPGRYLPTMVAKILPGVEFSFKTLYVEIRPVSKEFN